MFLGNSAPGIGDVNLDAAFMFNKTDLYLAARNIVFDGVDHQILQDMIETIAIAQNAYLRIALMNHVNADRA